MIIIPILQAAKYKKSLFQSLAFKRWFFLTNAFYFNRLQVFNPPEKRLLETSCARSRARFFTVDYNAVLCGTTLWAVNKQGFSFFGSHPRRLGRESLTDSENLQREYGLVVFLNGIVSSDVSQQIVQVEGTRFLNQELPKPFLL